MAEKNLFSFGVVKVEPNELKSKAEEVYNNIKTYENAMNNISDFIKSSRNYWVGDAGELLRQVFSYEEQEIDCVIEQFKDYPKQLLEYAGIYSETIKNAEETVSSINDFNM